MICTAPLLILTGGEAISTGTWWFRLYLLGIDGMFFAWFWTHGGQTLGMRAWRARLETTHGDAVTWRHAWLRLMAALLSISCGGLGYLWALVDKERLTWHDRISGTRVVLISREEMERAGQA
jgi:uncharacterized RDD family membrane protein YckC